MASKVMLEATQAVVDGNAVVVHSGELFEPGARLPDGVTVRPVMVSVPDAPAAAPEEQEPAPAPERAAKPAAKAPAK